MFNKPTEGQKRSCRFSFWYLCCRIHSRTLQTETQTSLMTHTGKTGPLQQAAILRHREGERQSTDTPWWQQRWAYAATLVQKHSQSPPRLQAHVSARQFM